MWKDMKQDWIAVVGIVLCLLACLFPPVWQTGPCQMEFAYRFLGSYLLLKEDYPQYVSIAWLELVFHLATIGIATVALLLDTGKKNRFARTSKVWRLLLCMALLCYFPYEVFFASELPVPFLGLSLLSNGIMRTLLLFGFAGMLLSALENAGMQSLSGWYKRYSVPLRILLLLMLAVPVTVLGTRIQTSIAIQRHDALNWALLWAVKSDNVFKTTDLLREGADASVSMSFDQRGQEVTDAGSCHTAYKQTALGIAARCGDLPLVRMLVDAGADIHQRTYLDRLGKECSLLTPAVDSGHKEVVAYLLAHGLQVREERDCNLLTLAVGMDSDLAKLLLDHGASVNAQFGKWDPPLTDAAFHGDIKTVQMLLQHGAAIDIQGENGNTALHEAVRGDKPDMVRFLLQHHANRHIKNRGGEIPLDLTSPDELAYPQPVSAKEIARLLKTG